LGGGPNSLVEPPVLVFHAEEDDLRAPDRWIRIAGSELALGDDRCVLGDEPVDLAVGQEPRRGREILERRRLIRN
jgi:hypothetical protein